MNQLYAEWIPMISKDKQALRAAAHSLKPVILLGSKGLTDAVLQEIDVALTAHELIKIKLPAIEREEKAAFLKIICDTLGTTLIQQIGRVAVLYRQKVD